MKSIRNGQIGAFQLDCDKSWVRETSTELCDWEWLERSNYIMVSTRDQARFLVNATVPAELPALAWATPQAFRWINGYNEMPGA